MPHTCCAFLKPDGCPCAARPLPNSTFCLFHDPAHQQSQAESRSKGGSAPRRRLRRFPRLLDHMHVAELLGELFVDSLNDPAAIDTKRLQALTALSRVLLKAVGTPPTFLVHSDRREPHPAAGHLLRVYPPLPPELEADLLAVEPPADPGTPPPVNSPVQEILTLDVGDGEAWGLAAEYLPPKPPSARHFAPPLPFRTRMIDLMASPEERPAVGAPLGRAAASGVPPAAAPPPGPPVARQAEQQALNRPRTGPLPIDGFRDLLPAALLPPPGAHPAPPLPAAAADPPAPYGARSILAAAIDAAASPAHLNSQTPEPLSPEQDPNRWGTGPSSTNGSQLVSAPMMRGVRQRYTPCVPSCSKSSRANVRSSRFV